MALFIIATRLMHLVDLFRLHLQVESKLFATTKYFDCQVVNKGIIFLLFSSCYSLIEIKINILMSIILLNSLFK